MYVLFYLKMSKIAINNELLEAFGCNNWKNMLTLKTYGNFGGQINV